VKKAFTLFEVVVSLVILSVFLTTIFNIFSQDNFVETYYELQQLENEYIQNKTVTDTENIKLD